MKAKPIEIELRRLNLALLELSPDLRDAVRRAVMRDVDGPETQLISVRSDSIDHNTVDRYTENADEAETAEALEHAR